jgi:hypothetical protein
MNLLEPQLEHQPQKVDVRGQIEELVLHDDEDFFVDGNEGQIV